MKEPPTVSIGMPVFNGQRFLREAIESLLGQAYTDFEMIISDNASEDDTEAICREYASRDSRIHYCRQNENIGAIANFNSVFRLAKGKYFKWASHDDLCESSFIQKCVSVLDERPEIMWCHCNSDMIDVEGRSWKYRLPADDEELVVGPDGTRHWKGLPRVDYDHDRPHRRFAGVLLGTRWSVDSYGLIRSDALRSTRLLVDLYGAEKVLMGELSLLGKTFQIDEELFQQRIHAEASSYKDNAASQQEFASARNKKPFVSSRLAILQAHIGAVRHATIPRKEKLACYVVLARYALQVSKWYRVGKAAVLGKGVGGGGKRIMQASRGLTTK